MKEDEAERESVYEAIVSAVSLVLGLEKKSVVISQIRSYNWSYIVWIFVGAENNGEEYVIKIPKTYNQQIIKEAFSGKDNAAQSLNEFQCLNKLYRNSDQDIKVSVVKPLYFVQEINGILLEKMRGDKLFELIRGKRISEEKILELLHRIGFFMSQCHQVNGVYNKSVFLDRIEVNNEVLQSRALDCLDYFHGDQNVDYTSMFLGFEIRNVFYCMDTDTITIHDLQEVNDRPVYEGIAQFVVSLDLINWGRLFPTRLPISYHQSFIDGCLGEERLKIGLLVRYIIKEYLRFCSNSKDMLSSKYGNLIGWIVFKFYRCKLINEWLSSKYWMQFKV